MGQLGFHGLYLLSLGAVWFAGATSDPGVPERSAPIQVSVPDSILSLRSAATSTESVDLNGSLAEFANGDLDLDVFIREWVERDPLGAIESLTQGEDCGPIMKWILVEWVRAAPDEASRWVEGQQGNLHYDFAVEGLLRYPSQLSKSNPEWALRLIRSVKCEVVSASLWFCNPAFYIMTQDVDLANTALRESGLPANAQVLLQEQWAEWLERFLEKSW